MHARRVKIKQEDAHCFLKELANKVVQMEQILAEKNKPVTYVNMVILHV